MSIIGIETTAIEAWLRQVLEPDAQLAALAPCQRVTPAGPFTLTYAGQTTPALGATAPAIGAGSVQAALEGLGSIGRGNVLVRRAPEGDAYLVTFTGALVNATALLAGAGAAVAARARVAIDLAPAGTPLPYVLITSQQLDDLRPAGLARIGVAARYTVRGVAAQQSYADPLASIAARIDALLHGQAGAVAGGGTIAACWRVQPVRLAEVDSGVQYRHLGGQYAVIVQ